MKGAEPRLVMIVEDDSEIREGLCDLLNEEGYRVVAAENGRQALEYLRSGPRPAVILLDLMMPVMNGWEFRQEQSRNLLLGDIPVAVMTAASELTASSIDAKEILPKPLPVERLLKVVKQYCSRSSSLPAAGLPENAAKAVEAATAWKKKSHLV
jgi:CheY-like chemotaxis protein